MYKENNMNQEFIPYQESLELKELGFDLKCIAYYTADTNQLSLVHGYGSLMFADYVHLSNTVKSVPCPLYQQAFRWFREKYDLIYVIVKAESWFFTINGCNTQEGFNTYEEAELACLRELIKLIK